MNLLNLVILALIGESVWETSKMVWQQGKLNIDRIGAIIIGLMLSIGTGLDLMSMIGIPIQIPYVGMILTGLLISRGANFIHDLLGGISKLNEEIK